MRAANDVRCENCDNDMMQVMRGGRCEWLHVTDVSEAWCEMGDVWCEMRGWVVGRVWSFATWEGNQILLFWVMGQDAKDAF